MTFNFLTSLFQKIVPQHKEKNPLLEKIELLKQESKFTIYDNVDIFLHKQRYTIPLMVYDPLRGIYLFEIKEWSFQELKEATITEVRQAKNAQNTLSYKTMQDGIRSKLDEVTHTSNIPLYNYLFMTNLSTLEYQNLDASVQKRLPQEKLIFNDMTSSAIIQKLKQERSNQQEYGSANKIIGVLLTQYTILTQEHQLFLVNPEQKSFIDTPLPKFATLNAPATSGITTTLLLKTIFEILKNPTLKVVIIKPTILSRDILHKTLLEIIEHSIISFDLLSVTILTREEAENKLQKKKKALADIVLCDDSSLMPKEFIKKLKSSQKRTTLLLANTKEKKPTFQLNKSYIERVSSFYFYKTNPHAKALQLTARLLKNREAKDIIIIANTHNREKLLEDLQFFVKESVNIVESSLSLAFQNLDGIKLLTYKDTLDIHFQDAILLDIEESVESEIEYIIAHTNSSLHILYTEETKEIKILKEKYEDRKE